MIFRTPDGQHHWLPDTQGQQAFSGDWSIGARSYTIGQSPDQLLFAGLRGMDPQVVFGAMMSGPEGMAWLRNAAMAKAAGGFSAHEKVPEDGKRLPLPIGPVTIAAGATAPISLQPQDSILVQQLVLQSTNAEQFDILSFTVGRDDQFVGDGALNGDLFSSAAQQNVQLKGSTANLGNIITLRVQNLDTVNAQVFRGMILGPTIRERG